MYNGVNAADFRVKIFTTAFFWEYLACVILFIYFVEFVLNFNFLLSVFPFVLHCFFLFTFSTVLGILVVGFGMYLTIS